VSSSSIPAENGRTTVKQEAVENGGQDHDAAQDPPAEQGCSEGDSPAKADESLTEDQEDEDHRLLEDVIYIGSIRRWCKGQRPGEPAWGLVYNKVYCTDSILVDEDGEKFKEGDLIAFKEVVAEEGYSKAEGAWLIDLEELQELEKKLAKVMDEQPARNRKVIQLDQNHQDGQHAMLAGRQPRPDGAGETAGAMTIETYGHQQQMPYRPGNAYPAAHGQPPGQPAPQHQPSQQAQVPLPLRKPNHMVLLEPPPMLAAFDAKACALCLQTNQWQGARAGSPRKWGSSPSVTSIGQSWFEALQQGIATAHATQAAEVQHNNWGGENMSQPWGMWNAGNQHSVDGAHRVGENYSGQMMGHEATHSWAMQQRWPNVS